ncbi:MAG TPA: DUF3575 domain-containing protein [Bacteroidia bacterium]|nr:DUF3575 domain-containing protein [Bacteroidia bacterium]
MKTKLKYLLNILLLVSIKIYSQDSIFFNTGAAVAGKIIEITEYAVKYKLKENLDGPTYSMDISRISKIKYSNGKVEKFESNPVFETTPDYDSIYIRQKNIIGVDAGQFFYSSIGLCYERFFDKENRFSIRIPFSIGFNYMYKNDDIVVTDNKAVNPNNMQNANYYIYQKGKIAGGSIEFNYYPLKFSEVNYFFGPYIDYGVFAYTVRYYDNNNYIYHYKPTKYDGQHYGFGINNGFLVHIGKHITISGNLGIGVKKDEMNLSGDPVLTQAKVNFIFGYKF